MKVDFCDVLLVSFFVSALPILAMGWLLSGVVFWIRTGKVHSPFAWIDLLTPMVCVLLWRNLLDWCQGSKGMDNVYEVSVAGGIWAVSILLRMGLLLRVPQCEGIFNVISFLLPLLTVLCYFYFKT